jgi:F420-0:gamma-glutamyl ligase
MTVEVKIGVQQAQRELLVEVDQSAEDIEKQVSEALASESGVITLTDTKGRRFVVPGAKVAYVEIGTGVAGMVGFRS